MRLAAGWRLLRHHLRPQRRALGHLAAWSALEAVPTFVSGLFIANAIDRGFLAHRPLAGFAWLAALALLWAIGAVGTRQAYPWLAATVEPLRDSLVTAVVTASLTRALRGEGDTGGSSISQATVQVETARALLSSLLRNMRQMLAAGVAAVGGLAVLSPLLALVVGSFVVLALAGFALLIPTLARRYAAVVRCGEQVSAAAAPVVEGLRDVVVYGAQDRAAREVSEAITAELRAVRAFAWAKVWRVALVMAGAQLPVLVFQEAYLFAGTIRDNLTYLQPQATQAEIDRAVAAVGLDECVARLGGDDAEIPPGGGTLSPGERQLVALARVYLSPAQVVILDEATCHLDPVAEAQAEQAFAERPGTLIVIAHRISSAMRAQRILVMDGAGAVLGSHRDLLATNSLYADLVGYWDHTMTPAALAAAAGSGQP